MWIEFLSISTWHAARDDNHVSTAEQATESFRQLELIL